MTIPDISLLIQQLMSVNEAKRLAARMTLLALEEDAVNPLVDEFYAGVTTTIGEAILEIISEIGGPDALAILRNVYHFEDENAVLRRAAVRGLLRNRENLDKDELDDLLGSMSDY